MILIQLPLKVTKIYLDANKFSIYGDSSSNLKQFYFKCSVCNTENMINIFSTGTINIVLDINSHLIECEKCHSKFEFGVKYKSDTSE